jgi:hypothetical protein
LTLGSEPTLSPQFVPDQVQYLTTEPSGRWTTTAELENGHDASLTLPIRPPSTDLREPQGSPERLQVTERGSRDSMMQVSTDDLQSKPKSPEHDLDQASTVFERPINTTHSVHEGLKESMRNSEATSTLITSSTTKLDAIESYFNTILLPRCLGFTANPWRDPEKRQRELWRLTGMADENVIFKLDEIESHGDEGIRSRRKALAEQTHKALNEVHTAAEENHYESKTGQQSEPSAKMQPRENTTHLVPALSSDGDGLVGQHSSLQSQGTRPFQQVHVLPPNIVPMNMQQQQTITTEELVDLSELPGPRPKGINYDNQYFANTETQRREAQGRGSSSPSRFNPRFVMGDEYPASKRNYVTSGTPSSSFDDEYMEIPDQNQRSESQGGATHLPEYLGPPDRRPSLRGVRLEVPKTSSNVPEPSSSPITHDHGKVQAWLQDNDSTRENAWALQYNEDKWVRQRERGDDRPRFVIVESPRPRDASQRPLKGILKAPTPQFPEYDNPIREGVAPHKDDTTKKDIPPGARWTKIDRRLVNPESLTIGRERFEIRDEFVIVLRVLSKEEVQAYALATEQIRGM